MWKLKHHYLNVLPLCCTPVCCCGCIDFRFICPCAPLSTTVGHFTCSSEGFFLSKWAVLGQNKLQNAVELMSMVKNLSGLYHKYYLSSLFLCFFKWFDWINCMINQFNHISLFSKKSPWMTIIQRCYLWQMSWKDITESLECKILFISISLSIIGLQSTAMCNAFELVHLSLFIFVLSAFSKCDLASCL